jgi:hypothetical protein
MYSAHVQWYASYPCQTQAFPISRWEELFEGERRLNRMHMAGIFVPGRVQLRQVRESCDD